MLSALGLVVLAAAALVAVVLPDTPSTVGRTVAGERSLEVELATGLDPAGAEVRVRGAGFDERKGIYVAFCVVPSPGDLPSPCGGGIDTTGSSGSSIWVSSDPPPYGEGLAVPFGPGGTFDVALRVQSPILDVDCRAVSCGVVTRADHTRTDDRSQDLVVPVTFLASSPGPGVAVILATMGGLLIVAGIGIGLAARVRRRRAAAAVAVAVVVLAVAGCTGSSGPPAAATTSEPGAGVSCQPTTARVDDGVTPVAGGGDADPDLPVSVTSADGTTVTVRDASRILAVNLYGSIAEIVFSLGLGDRVVGRDASTTFEAAADLPLVTVGGHDLSAEAILRLDPTVVLADASIGPPEVLDQLRASGIPVVLLDDEPTLERIPAHIRAVAAALGVPDDGERLVERVEAEMAAAATQVPTDAAPLTVAFLYIRGTAGVYLMAGDGAGPDAMIEGIGARDAGTEIGLQGFRPITSEALIEAAPDVILLLSGGLDSVGGVDGLLAQPGIAQTPAGATRRIVDMDDGVLLNFGARTGRAMQALAAAVYGGCAAP